MAIVDRPEDLDIDTMSASLQEGEDVAQESITYSGVVGLVEDRYSKSKTWRLQDEERWLRAYRNYRGIYGPEVQFTSSEKSKVFVKVTKTKTLAAYGQI